MSENNEEIKQTPESDAPILIGYFAELTNVKHPCPEWMMTGIIKEIHEKATAPIPIPALIAAAPELLDACKALIPILEAVRYTAGLGKTQLARIEAAKAAIAKAEGKES